MREKRGKAPWVLSIVEGSRDSIFEQAWRALLRRAYGSNFAENYNRCGRVIGRESGKNLPFKAQISVSREEDMANGAPYLIHFMCFI